MLVARVGSARPLVLALGLAWSGVVACASDSAAPDGETTADPTATATAEERTTLCRTLKTACNNFAEAYGDEATCLERHDHAARCYTDKLHACTSSACLGAEGFESCQVDAIRACDPSSAPADVTRCKARNEACKEGYASAEIAEAVETACEHVPSLDRVTREGAADACVKGECQALRSCLEELEP